MHILRERYYLLDEGAKKDLQRLFEDLDLEEVMGDREFQKETLQMHVGELSNQGLA